MASFYLAPDPIQSTQFIPGGNTPASGGQLFFYQAGSSTKSTVYKDSGGLAQHTNPLVLDSGGNIPNGGVVWFATGISYKVVFAPATDVDPPQSPYWTKDNLPGINDISSSAAVEFLTGPSPTFIGPTQFALAGDQSLTFKNGRRIRTQNTAGTVYGRITSIIVSAGSTTVNTVSDSGASLDSGLNATAYSLLDPQFTSITEYHVNRDGGSVSSSGNGTTDIWGIKGDSLHITGTNTIRCFSSAAYAGAQRTIIFDGALTLQTSAAFLSCPSGNIVTVAGDRAEVLASTTVHSVITQYQRADGTPLALTTSAFGSQSSGSVFAGPSTGANATPTFRNLVARESALILLASRTVAATTSILITSTDGVDFTAYDEYRFQFYNFQNQTNNASMIFRVSLDHGLTTVTSNSYNVAITGGDQTTTSGDSGSGGGSNFVNMFSFAANFGQTTSANHSANGVLTLFNPSTSIFKNFISDFVYTNANGLLTRTANAASFVATNPVNGMQFLYSAGSINAGTIRCYGVRKT
jgi:hypothetical protein